jgi:DNA-binding NtrC family response regulator
MDLREPLGGTPQGPDAVETPAAAEERDKTSMVRSLVGRSRAFRLVYEQIERAAGSDVPVLLYGETGTGKELAAQAIHEMSSRRKGPFIRVTTSTIPKDQVEMILAGARSGARPDVNADVPGKFEEANGGTIFIDEVGILDDKAQVVLLRFLETREVQRLGDAEPRRVDGRVIAATTHDLKAKVEAGDFREDLFYRLQVFAITMPPLRERKEDIPRLARRFLTEIAEEQGQDGERRALSPAALEVLKRYRWPGNVRELRNSIRAAALAGGDARLLEPDHLPEAVRRATPSLEAVTIPVGTTLEEAERTIIQRTVEATGGNKKEAAQVLGISRSALYAKLKRLDIEL